ncbi:hypothetical protein [Cellulosimicrobium sp. Marseille-Q4280]|uniref:hypothetical protein n=1 Tax=Cellulosimicrobium sp. Marseille-Q4280 TaxID=2937992 RepID=UPI0020403E6E|nr:hypothetical protein [Cellulosimicrobium sp. Marseille-Q4280]
MSTETGQGGRRRSPRHVTAVLLTAGVVCAGAACSWDGEQPAPDAGTATDGAAPPAQGGASGGSPVRMGTAAQQIGIDFAEVRATFLDEMTASCGGELCVTVVSDPSDAGPGCLYDGSDPAWREDLTVERWSTVVLLADCSATTTDPGSTDPGSTEPGATDPGTTSTTSTTTGTGGDPSGTDAGGGTTGDGP